MKPKRKSPLCPSGTPVLIDSYSHYFNEATISRVLSDSSKMGTTDAGLENGEITCTGSNYADVLAILDFGQPFYATAKGTVWEVRDFGGPTLT